MTGPWEGGQDPREEEYARRTRQEWCSSSRNLMGKGTGRVHIRSSKSVCRGAAWVRLDRQTEYRLWKAWNTVLKARSIIWIREWETRLQAKREPQLCSEQGPRSRSAIAAPSPPRLPAWVHRCLVTKRWSI